MRKSGFIVFIIPNNILTNSNYNLVRKFILNSYIIKLVIDIGSSVFESASVDSCIFSIQNSSPNITSKLNYSLINKDQFHNLSYKSYLQEDFKKTPDNIFNFYLKPDESLLINKISNRSFHLLEKFVKISRGIELGYSSEFVTNVSTKKSVKLIAGRCFNKYKLIFENKYIEPNFDDTSNFKSKDIYEVDKIFIRRIGKEIIGFLDVDNYYNVCDVYNLISKSAQNDKLMLYIILANLNSKLLSFYFSNNFKNAKILFPKIAIKQLKTLPIVLNNSLGLIAEKIQELKKLNESTFLLENQIDINIYHLYDLTYEEACIIDPNLSKEDWEKYRLNE